MEELMRSKYYREALTDVLFADQSKENVRLVDSFIGKLALLLRQSEMWKYDPKYGYATPGSRYREVPDPDPKDHSYFKPREEEADMIVRFLRTLGLDGRELPEVDGLELYAFCEEAVPLLVQALNPAPLYENTLREQLIAGEVTMSDINYYEYAARTELRFSTSKGLISVEQLWKLPLRSKDAFNLNEVAKELHRALTTSDTISFVDGGGANPERTKATIAFELVKHIIATKLEEEKAAETRAANKAKKEKLLAILAEKQTGALSALSVEELEKQIASL